MTTFTAPTLEAIRQAQERLSPYVLNTPVVPWVGKVIERVLGEKTEICAKLELMQYAGSFKVRGVLLRIMQLSEDERNRGVVAVSAGNHAIAVCYAAEMLGINAKVVMPKYVDRIRIEKCKSRGAEVVLTDSFQLAFDTVNTVLVEEGRTLIHPYEGENIVLGTATLGLEFIEQTDPRVEAIIVGVGGGGLAAGVASAVKQFEPQCQVFGVEPEGADAMFQSLAAGEPKTVTDVDTIADSLTPPSVLPFTFSLCQQHLDEVVRVSDQELRTAMNFLFYDLKLAVEPAAAAACAGMIGPLRDKLSGKRIGLILCGSSIDADQFIGHLELAKGTYMKYLSGS